jgi:cell wall-associated NlpC family hydrolase
MAKSKFLIALPLLTAFMITTTAVTPASATFSYNRAAAVAYAHNYACNLDRSCRNSAYVDLGDTDCTNFVSQVLKAGGVPSNNSGQGFQQWWYASGSNWSYSWSHAYDLNVYLQTSGFAASSRPNLANKFSGANAAGGDVYLYDWGRGEGWSHVAFSTGHETYYPFYDPNLQVNYSSINGGSGDAIAQHANDRDHAPWNIGYMTELDPLVKSQMKVVLLSMN